MDWRDRNYFSQGRIVASVCGFVAALAKKEWNYINCPSPRKKREKKKEKRKEKRKSKKEKKDESRRNDPAASTRRKKENFISSIIIMCRHRCIYTPRAAGRK